MSSDRHDDNRHKPQGLYRPGPLRVPYWDDRAGEDRPSDTERQPRS